LPRGSRVSVNGTVFSDKIPGYLSEFLFPLMKECSTTGGHGTTEPQSFATSQLKVDDNDEQKSDAGPNVDLE
jgi:hypothetical protein